MSLVDDALNYAGIGDIVDASSGTFTDASYAGCADALAAYIGAIAALEGSCAAFTGLLVGEVPSLGADTWATIVAGAACYVAYKNYVEKATALANCIASVDQQRSASLSSAASTTDQNLDAVAEQAVAMGEQQQGSAQV